MKINKIAGLCLLVAALTSNYSVSEENKEQKKAIRLIEPHYDPSLTLKGNELKAYNKNNFEVNRDSFYLGEKIYINQPMNNYVSATAIVLHPSEKIYEDDTNYNDINEKEFIDENGKKYKLIVDTSKANLYAVLKAKQDYKNDNREKVVDNQIKIILLKENVKLLDINKSELYDGISYDKLKTLDTEHYRYSINTMYEAFDDDSEIFNDDNEYNEDNDPINNLYTKIYESASQKEDYNDEYDDILRERLPKSLNYEDFYNSVKYKDMDDYVGYKLAKVDKIISGENTIKSEDVLVKFGTEIKDFKGNYETLLTDLNKTPLKFAKDEYDEMYVDGGFDKYYTEKILKFHKIVPHSSKVEFITEILDKDKTNVGIHNISRKIKVDGVVVYEKKDKAFISFEGTTVGVVDGNFFDTSDEVEKRIFRYTPKENDPVENFVNESTYPSAKKDALQNLTRTHGSTVIGTMIDEVSTGDRFYWLGSFLGQLADIGIKGEYTEDFNEERVLKVMDNFITSFEEKYNDEKVSTAKFDIQYLLKNIRKEIDKIKQINDMADVSDEIKNEAKKVVFESIKKVSFDYYMLPEDEKVKTTDMHFSTITIGGGGPRVNVAIAKEKLSDMLDKNKSIKAVNMSYGSSIDFNEYKKLKEMTQEDKERAVSAYNDPNDATFRTAVLAYLYSDLQEGNDYYKVFHGTLNIPSVYSYFETRDKITVEDYQKLIDLRILSIENSLNTLAELNASNHDVVFYRAQGNTTPSAGINLTDFDGKGKKIIYLDPNKIENNPFVTIPNINNYNKKKEANEQGIPYKYDYSYRKNIVGVVGLAPKILVAGADATDNISNDWGLFTSAAINYHKLKMFGKGTLSYYNKLIDEVNNFDSSNYSEDYKKEIKKRIESINNLANLYSGNKDTKFSFKRAGDAMLWTLAADGTYVYTKKLTDEEKKYSTKDERYKYGEKDSDTESGKAYDYASSISVGSSFAAPRATAVAGRVGTLFPFMSAHDIKTTLLTTAIDDYRTIPDPENDKKTKIVGIYGVDRNIGWGILDKVAAYKGPARFVKALTREVGQEDFIADVPYGTYVFGNSIEGGFNPVVHAASRNFITDKEAGAFILTSNFTINQLKDKDFFKDKEELKNTLDEMKITPEYIADVLRPKMKTYIPSLPEEERDLFESAGFIKRGNGTLILKGINTYSEDTKVEGGSLVIQGSLESTVKIEKGAKLKLDGSNISKLNFARILLGRPPISAGIKNNVENKGSLYSYSEKDEITKSYIPYKNSKTLLASIATLNIGKLDLSNVDQFNFDIFRKKFMVTLPIPEDRSAGFLEGYSDDIRKELQKTDYNKRMILHINNISDQDLMKMALVNRDLSSSLKLRYELIEKEGTNNELKVYIERKNPIKFDYKKDEATSDTNSESNETTNSENTSNENSLNNSSNSSEENEESKLTINSPKIINLLRTNILNKINSGELTLKFANNIIDKIDWLSEDEVNSINGDLITDSIRIGINNEKSRLRTYQNLLNSDINKKFKIFATSDTSFEKFHNQNKQKYAITAGTQFGALYKTKYTKTGFALDYANSKLRQVSLKVKDDISPINESLSKKNQTRLGIVDFNMFGLSALNNVEYKNFYLNTVLGSMYISKTTAREIDNYKVLNSNASDVIVNLSNEFGYSYNKKFNNNIELNVRPYLGLNLVNYTKGDYNENDEIGFVGNTENFFNVDTNIGAEIGVKLFNRATISLFGDYTKYLTDTNLKTKARLDEFKFDIYKGLTLEDNLINFGIKTNVIVNDKFNIDLSYKNNKLKNHNFKLELNLEF